MYNKGAAKVINILYMGSLCSLFEADVCLAWEVSAACKEALNLFRKL